MGKTHLGLGGSPIARSVSLLPWLLAILTVRGLLPVAQVLACKGPLAGDLAPAHICSSTARSIVGLFSQSIK